MVLIFPMLRVLLVCLLLATQQRPVNGWVSGGWSISSSTRLLPGPLQRPLLTVCPAKGARQGGVEQSKKDASFMRELEDAGVQCEALELASFDGLRGVSSDRLHVSHGLVLTIQTTTGKGKERTATRPDHVVLPSISHHGSCFAFRVSLPTAHQRSVLAGCALVSAACSLACRRGGERR